MNAIDKNPNYREIYKYVRAKFDHSAHFGHGPFDETYFSLRVYESAKEIAKKLNKKIKKEQLLVAAILHDVGKVKLHMPKLFSKRDFLGHGSKEWYRHAKLGAEMAATYLSRKGYSEEFVREVKYLIANHDKSGSSSRKKYLELKILQDADLIADIGFAGFIRPFLYSGKFSQYSVINTIKFVQREDRTRQGRELNLPVSRAIAKRELKIQRRLAKEILKELDTDLV